MKKAIYIILVLFFAFSYSCGEFGPHQDSTSSSQSPSTPTSDPAPAPAPAPAPDPTPAPAPDPTPAPAPSPSPSPEPAPAPAPEIQKWEFTGSTSLQSDAISVLQTDSDYIAVTAFYFLKLSATGQVIKEEVNDSNTGGANSMTAAPDSNFVITGNGGASVLLRKIDSSGNIIWSKDFTQTVIQDNPLSVFKASAAGFFISNTSDGGYIIAGKIEAGFSYPDLYIAKVDSEGTLMWDRSFTFNDGRALTGYAAFETDDKGFLIAGTADNLLNASFLLVKYDAGGNFLWEKEIGQSASSRICMDRTSDGNFIVGGGEPKHIWKIGPEGNVIWKKSFDVGTIRGIHTVPDGFVMTGSTQNEENVFLLKTDMDGKQSWKKTYGAGTGNDVRQASDGGYIVAGQNTASLPYLIKTDSEGNSK